MADTIGLYNPSNGFFYMRDASGDVTDFRFGPSGATGWQALTGDWNNDGIDTAGLYNPANGIVYLINDAVPTDSTVVTSYRFGPSGAEGWQAIAGDWDGVNGDSVSLYNPATGMIYVNNALAGGSVPGFRFGPSGADWQAIGGDWDNNGSDSVSLYDPSTGIIYINNALASASVAGYRFGPSGATGWEAVAGDWDGANGDSVSLYNPATGNFYINNALAGGSVDGLRFGPSGATGWQPLSGTWAAPALTFELTAAATPAQVNEGSSLLFTVTLSAAQATATTVTFLLKPGDAVAANQGTTTTNLNDFSGGAFNPVTVTIPAGQLTGTFSVTPFADGITELPETFSVDATVTGLATQSLVATVLDGGQSGGQTFTLTIGQDSVAGGAGTDQIFGTVGADAATTTLNSFDVINGGDGNDTFNVSLSGGDYDGDTTISNVETFLVRATGDARTFDANGLTGVTTLQNDRSSQDLGFTGVASSATKIVVDRMANDFDTVAEFASTALAGATTNVALELRGVAVAGTESEVNLYGAAGTTDGIEILTLTGGGSAASFLGALTVTKTDVGASSLTKLVFNGAQDVTIGGAALDFVGTEAGGQTSVVDASAATGGLGVLFAVNEKVSVTGGAGDDTFGMADGLDTTDTIAGGEGTDRVIVSEDQTTVLSNVTGIEELWISDSDSDAAVEISGKAIASATNFVVAVTDDDNDDGEGYVVTLSNLDDGDTVTVEQASSDTDDQDEGTQVILTSATDTSTNAVNLVLAGIGATTDDTDDDSGINSIQVSNIETVALTSTVDTDVVGLVGPAAIDPDAANGVIELIAAGTKTLTLSGAVDLDIATITNTAALTSIDATALTGDLSTSVTVASNLNFKAGSGETTLTMTGLNATDTITGGVSTKDQLTATTVTGLTATTGKLNVTNMDTVILQVTGANTIDASLMTGVSTLAFSGDTATTQTVTGLAAGTAIGLGEETAELEGGALVSVALANATGTTDSLTFKVDNRGGGDTDVNLKASGIENVTLSVLDDDTANDMLVDMTQVKATTLTVTGGFAGAKINLDTLAAETTTVTTTAYKGDVVFSGANAAAAMTVSTAAATADSDITLSAKNDTITVAETAGVAVSIDGGAGNDTLNLAVKAGFTNTQNIEGIEFINLAVRAGDDIVIGGNADEVNGIDAATKLTVTGGNELSLLTIGGAGDKLADTTPSLKTIDASAFLGAIALTYAADALTSEVTVTGGASTDDTINALYDTDDSDIEFKLTGVENLNIYADSGTQGSEAYTFDLGSATGLETLSLGTSEDDDTAVTIDNYTADVVIQLGNALETYQNESTLAVNLESNTGTADVLNLGLFDTDDDDDVVAITAAGVEVLNIAVDDEEETSHLLNLAGVAATTAATQTITVTGGVADESVVLADVAATARVINGADFVGDLVLLDRGASAMTLTGGTGDDTLRMEHAADVIAAGDGTDTLTISINAILGGFAIDLSATGDQVTTFNGSANAAVQSGFENLDASGVTGVFGAQITANEDGSVIRGTSGNDQITLDDGVDVIVFSAAAANGTDTVVDFTVAEDLLDLTLLDVTSEAAVAADAALITPAVDKTAYVFADGSNGTDAAAISDYTNLTDVAVFLEAGLAADEDHTYVAVINDLAGDKAYVYSIDVSADTTVDDQIDAGDLTLVGIVGTAAAVTIGNVVFDAP